MRIACLLAVSATALGLMGFQDSKNQYTVDFPEGWTVAPTDAQGITSANPAGEASGMSCNAQHNPMPGLAGFTQDQINTELSKPFDTASWANLLSMDIAILSSEATEAGVVDGKLLQIGTVTIKASPGKNAVDMKARFAVWVMPSGLTIAGCFAQASNYDSVKDVFEKTIRSLHPL